jgi:hypothetical protein
MLQGLTRKVGSFFSGLGTQALKSSALSGKSLGMLGRAAAHPMLTGAGLGAIGGYAGSGTIGGALTGAALGAGGGALGWNRYHPKKGSLTRRRIAGKLGRRISKTVPGFAQAVGGTPGLTAGQARNLGGKKLGMAALGAGMMLGAGVSGGFAYGSTIGLGTSLVKNLGGTFGSQTSAHFGNAFSGMGNGTTTGY